MLRIAWWATITLLIVESCANKPVVSLEAAGSFVIELPRMIGNETFFRLVASPSAMNRDSTGLLYLLIRPVDSVWVYQVGTASPIRRFRLPISGAIPQEMMFDSYSKRLHVVCELPSPRGVRHVLLQFNADLSLNHVDTIAPLRDEYGVDYVPLAPASIRSNIYRTAVAAIGDYRQFLMSSSIAQYDRERKQWSFIHRRPREIREDTIRPFFFPLFAEGRGTNGVQYFRYQASDSLYRVQSSGIVQNVAHFARVITDYHAPLPERQYTSSFLCATEPHVVYYNYLPAEDLHLSIVMKRQPERLPDGRLADEGTAKHVVQLFNNDHAEEMPLPTGLLCDFPCPLVLGDRIAFARRSRADRQAGRMTFAMYRIALK